MADFRRGHELRHSFSVQRLRRIAVRGLFDCDRLANDFPESSVRELDGIIFVVGSEHTFMDLDASERIQRKV